MLALSASDISDTQPSPSGPELTCTAITHRVRAISSLNKAICSGIQSSEQGNAMLATCCALFLQSTYINNGGLVEYMTFIRGCIIIGAQMDTRNMKLLFNSMWGDENVSAIDSSRVTEPLINPDRVAASCRSFEQFAHLCKGKQEAEMHGLLLGTARALYTSSQDGRRQPFQFFRHKGTANSSQHSRS